MPHKLRVEYRTSESFQTEYAQNIAKGGIFVPTRQAIEMRARVELELVLAFSGQSVALPGEVVHCIPPEMAESGAQPGVAIQFLLDGDELRGKLAAFSAPVAMNVDECEQGTGRRIAPRVRAHLAADVQLGEDWIAAHTRNLSCSGALLELPGDAPEIGSRLKVRIKLPGGREQMKLGAQVSRHLGTVGAACIGVQFQIPEAREGAVAEFVDRVRAVEHSRRLGGINGPIAALGIRSVLAMFGTSAPEGMLTLTRGDEEGYILIDHGQLRAQVAVSSGRPALDELLSWQEGSFSFEGQVDETLVVGEAIPASELTDQGGETPAPAPAEADGGLESEIPAADEEEELVLMDLEELLPEDESTPSSEEAQDDTSELGLDDESWNLDPNLDEAVAPEPAREDGFVPDGDHSLGKFVLDEEEADAIEESLRVDTAPIDPAATLVLGGEADRSELGKTEEALLDLATAGLTVAKAIEIIPEPEEQVYAALENLIHEGFLRLA